MSIALLITFLLVATPVIACSGGAVAIFFAVRARKNKSLPSPVEAPSHGRELRNLAPQILELASVRGGRVTADEAAEALGVKASVARECLAGLVNRRLCHAEPGLGATCYTFQKPAAVTTSGFLQLTPGFLLAERYQIVRSLNKGGMGAIYEAVDQKLAGSACAVKEILETALRCKQGEYVQERFREEMKALANLDHPCIPKVRDFLEVDGSFYIVMDLVRGISLEQELEQNSPVAPERAVSDILRLLQVVQYLHSHNPPVIHRDIKPANLMRDAASGLLKLVDFGLARTSENRGTQTAVGTMGYCAPEQMSGKADARSDIFSVGSTLSQLVSGLRPEWVWAEPLRQELPSSCEGLGAIIAKATQPDPADRYVSALEMASDLESWQQSRKVAGSVTQALDSNVAAANR